jgi:hypothetical protein
MKLDGITKQKMIDSSAGAASMLMGSLRQPLRLTLHVSTRKKASLPVVLSANPRRPGQWDWPEKPLATALIRVV